MQSMNVILYVYLSEFGGHGGGCSPLYLLLMHTPFERHTQQMLAQVQLFLITAKLRLLPESLPRCPKVSEGQ